ncbi:alginate export family protein [bacterium]|nr:alginate export family protein [bacterium]
MPAVMALAAGAAVAGWAVAPRAEDAPLIDFRILRDAPRGTEILRNLFVGGDVEIEFDATDDLDLISSEDDAEVDTASRFKIYSTFKPTQNFWAYGEVQLVHNRLLDSPDGGEHDTQLLIREAYLAFSDLAPGLSFIVGRTDFEDAREWIWDEKLDGARAIWRSGPWGVEAAVAQEDWLPADILHPNDRRDEPTNIYLHGYRAIGEDSEASAYALHRADGRDDEDLLFLGVQSIGELTDEVEYWLDAAAVFGDADGRDVAGYAVDLGATYVFDAPFEPSITLGGAFGSGDDGEGDDSAFRQTGDQDNNFRFNGVTSFKIYGEIFDPELSNMFITTAGVGVKPSDRSSVDLVWHHYRQHRKSDDIRDSALDADPTGLSGHLGDEIDLVVGIREISNVLFEATAGIFLPGDAFEDKDPAYGGGLKVTIGF